MNALTCAYGGGRKNPPKMLVIISATVTELSGLSRLRASPSTANLSGRRRCILDKQGAHSSLRSGVSSHLPRGVGVSKTLDAMSEKLRRKPLPPKHLQKKNFN